MRRSDNRDGGRTPTGSGRRKRSSRQPSASRTDDSTVDLEVPESSRRIRTLTGTTHTLEPIKVLPPRISAGSFRGWQQECDTDDDDYNVVTEIKKPPVNVNGVPEIPFFVPTDQHVAMSKINDSWILTDKDLSNNLISANLRRSFSLAENPFSDALFFIVHSRDFRGEKVPGSLAHKIVAELKQWLMEWRIVDIQTKCLTPELQIAAFMIVTLQKAPDLIGIVCDVFRLDLIRGQLGKPILELCRARKYTEACHVATFADVTIGICVHDFVLPLLLQDMEIVTSAYLADHVDTQRELLTFFEEIKMKKDIYRALKDYVLSHNIEGYKPEKLEKKQFDKMCLRFNTKYRSCLDGFKIDDGIDVVEIPFRSPLQGNSLKPNEKDKTDVNWNAVLNANNNIPGPTAFQSIAAFEKFAAAQKLNGEGIKTIFTGVHKPDAWETLSSSSSEFNFEDSISSSAYKVAVSKDKFFMFHSSEEVRIFTQHLMAAQTVRRQRSGRSDDYLVVTIDAKWNIYGTLRRGISLLAIGLVDEVYIIDLFRLQESTKRSTDAWELLRVALFMNAGIVKVGYFHQKVIAALAKSHPTWSNLEHEFKLYVDLGIVANVLISKKINIYPNVSAQQEGGFGIGELVRISFGKQLDRPSYMSNWEQRPLSKLQIYHTAMDSFVLFDILNSMNKRCTNHKIDFEKVVVESLSPNPSLIPYPGYFDIPGRTKMFPGKGRYNHPVGPETIQVVCDPALGKLGQQLRAIGMDCLIPSDDAACMNCIKLAQRDIRSLVITPDVWEDLYDIMAIDKCCVLQTTTVIDRLEEIIKHYNVYVNDVDLYTRCQVCNSNRFLAVRNGTMQRLVKRNKRKVDNNLVEPDIHTRIPRCAERLLPFKKWVLIPECKLKIKDAKNIRTSSGAPIILQFLTPTQLENVATFIICDNCGQIYLDESVHEIAIEPKFALKILQSSTSRFGLHPTFEDKILEAANQKSDRKSKKSSLRPGMTAPATYRRRGAYDF